MDWIPCCKVQAWFGVKCSRWVTHISGNAVGRSPPTDARADSSLNVTTAAGFVMPVVVILNSRCTKNADAEAILRWSRQRVRTRLRC